MKSLTNLARNALLIGASSLVLGGCNRVTIQCGEDFRRYPPGINIKRGTLTLYLPKTDQNEIKVFSNALVVIRNKGEICFFDEAGKTHRYSGSYLFNYN